MAVFELPALNFQSGFVLTKCIKMKGAKNAYKKTT